MWSYAFYLFWLSKNTAFPQFSPFLCRDKECYTKCGHQCVSKPPYKKRTHWAMPIENTSREQCLTFIFFGDLKFDIFEMLWEQIPSQKDKQIYIGSWIFLFFRQELDRITHEDAHLGIMWDFLFSDFRLDKTYDALCANTLLRNKQWNEITPTTLLSAFNSTNSEYFENSHYIDHIQEVLTGCVREVKITCAKLGNKIVPPTPEERIMLNAKVKTEILNWERIAHMACLTLYRV